MRWDRASNSTNANPETETEIKNQQWLRYYVYERASPTLGAGLGRMWSFLVCAFWHGFYEGYYFTFFFGGLMNEVGSQLRKTIRPIFGTKVGERRGRAEYKTPAWYNFLGWFLGVTTLNYCVTPFVLLRWTSAVALFNHTYWYAPVGVASVYAACVAYRSVAGGKRKSKSAKKEAKEMEEKSK